MSHLSCPASAWRNARLRITPLDDEGRPSDALAARIIYAGTFADEHHATVLTSIVRSLAEGHRPEGVTAGGAGAAPAYLATLDTPLGAAPSAGMSEGPAAPSPHATPRAAASPAGRATVTREAAAHAAQRLAGLIDGADAEVRALSARLEASLDAVSDLRTALRAARNDAAELRQHHAEFLASIGAA